MTYSARHRMLTAAVAGLLSASFAVAASGAATAAPRSASACNLISLPFPADAYRGEADAVDPTGRFVAGTGLRIEEDGNQLLLLVWDRGRLTTIESSLAGSVADVNARGVVVGNGAITGRSRPWAYRNGTLELLPAPPGYVMAEAINKAGDIVGFVQEVDTGRTSPLRWPAARPGTYEMLDAPADAAAAGITQDGTIVGYAGEFGAWTSWVRRPDGRVETLTVPGARWTQVHTAQGHWAIGLVDLGGQSSVRVRWDLRNGSWSRIPDKLAWVTDVNARGTVIGDEVVARGTATRILPGSGEGVNVGANAIADTSVIERHCRIPQRPPRRRPGHAGAVGRLLTSRRHTATG
ncbi:hypothetical protein [Micromonospora sp. KC721]|uniref:hypothetical protein n=1 Tax=Micromonospora sp. KC721 TaxID=2530380 RepID=UPI00105261F8|nr:hypothetical protein [Micromonospora sp. KC721]TDB81671.1 hypothetical protein E1182_04185 [Micromonospora sp. KC721]